MAEPKPLPEYVIRNINGEPVVGIKPGTGKKDLPKMGLRWPRLGKKLILDPNFDNDGVERESEGEDPYANRLR